MNPVDKLVYLLLAVLVMTVAALSVLGITALILEMMKAYS